MPPESFGCYLVEKDATGAVRAGLTSRPVTELPAGDVLVRVLWSALNYKDALAARGHPGVARQFPHIPGIDAVGTVETSNCPDFQPGQLVLVSDYDIGSGRWGSWAEYLRAPAGWVMPQPEGLSPRETIILGTAGFTASLCVAALQSHEVRPESGEVVVSGASGGVGCLAVQLLAKLGYAVVAVTGKPASHELLRRWGARQILSREAAVDADPRPLLSARWAGGIDTVGGHVLATLVRQTRPGGCVAACGVAGGAELPLTVYPFILRGVTLAGIDAAWCPMTQRRQVWSQLAGRWRLEGLEAVATTVRLGDLDPYIDRMLQGRGATRAVVQIAAE